MKLRSVGLLLLAVALLLAPAGASAASARGGDLFVLQARSGVIEGKRLILRGIESRVTTFTDRPERTAGSVPSTRFVSGWDRTFGSVPPNAALEVEGVPAGRDVALLELRNPRYDGRTNSLVYSIRRLKKTGDDALAEFDGRADGNRVVSFGPSSLFIDSGAEPSIKAVVRFYVPAGGSGSVKFDAEATFAAGAGLISGIITPPAQATPESAPTASAGLIQVSGSRLAFSATSGGGLQAEVLATLMPDADGQITGTASLPPGSEVQVFRSGEAIPLSDGEFSFPE